MTLKSESELPYAVQDILVQTAIKDYKRINTTSPTKKDVLDRVNQMNNIDNIYFSLEQVENSLKRLENGKFVKPKKGSGDIIVYDSS